LSGALVAAMLAAPALAADPEGLQPPPETAGPNGPGAASGSDDVMLRVDVVRLARGYRVSKIIGQTVYNDAGEKIGTIDDLIVRPDDRLMFGVVSVGGFLGIGDRLIAVPYQAFMSGSDGKLVLAGITKDDLKNAPAFRYDTDKK
jgi:hypothetical protein